MIDGFVHYLVDNSKIQLTNQTGRLLDTVLRSGTNLPRIADYNQGVVLEAVRVADGISRVEIAQNTGLTAQTISNIVKRLIDRGLVIEADRAVSNGGKRRVRLRANPDSAYAVGVQIDGDETSFVIANLTGQVVARHRQPTFHEQGPLATIEQIATSIKQIVEKAEIPDDKTVGVGVACPGPLDHTRSIVFQPPNLPGWQEVPLQELLERKTGYAVVVDNDATAAAIGERWFGGAKSTSNFAFIYAGVGIGAGLFLKDHVYRGASANAGEFGHMTLNPNGPECFCGNRGCIEVYCSPQGLTQSVKQRLKQGEPSSLRTAFDNVMENVDFQAVEYAVLSGDNVAIEELQKSATLLGYGVVNLVNMLDVELVVLGGKGFRCLGDIYKQEIEHVLQSRLIARQFRKIEVKLSEAGEDVGALGAASLVLHKTYSPHLAALSKV